MCDVNVTKHEWSANVPNDSKHRWCLNVKNLSGRPLSQMSHNLSAEKL